MTPHALPRLPTLPVAARPPATALSCLRCQLLGRRRLLCDAADACARLPRQLPVGPALLLAWLLTAAAFLRAIW